MGCCTSSPASPIASGDWVLAEKAGLFKAAQCNDEAAALRALNGGADVNEKDQVRVPLACPRAARVGMPALARVPLTRTARGGGRGTPHRMALHELTALSLPCHVCCASLQLREDTPLHFAAEGGHASMVKLLVERGANVNETSQVRRLHCMRGRRGIGDP